MFTDKGLSEQLNKMKAGWIEGLEETKYWIRPWEILHNASMVNKYKIDRNLACVSVDTGDDGSKRIIFRFPTQTFSLTRQFGGGCYSLECYAAQNPMLPLKHCTKFRVFKCFSGGSECHPSQQSFMSIEYQMPEDGSVSTLQSRVEEDLQVIEHNTKILMAEVRDWLDSNMPDVLEVIAKDRHKAYADPIENMATAVAESMGIIRTHSY